MCHACACVGRYPVTPLKSSLEFVRRHTWGYVRITSYAKRCSQNEKLQHENGQLKLQNQYLKSELSTADRAQALSVFQPIAIQVPGRARHRQRHRRKLQVVFVDRGSPAE